VWLARLAGGHARTDLSRMMIAVPMADPETAERVAYRAQRGVDRVRSVTALDTSAATLAEVERQEAAIRSAAVGELRAAGFAVALPEPPVPSGRVPRRLVAGTLQESRIPVERLATWRKRLQAAHVTGAVPDCALFWADGRRSVGEITCLVKHELEVP